MWPLVQAGLKPVFVDIDPKTLNIDLKELKKKITKKTKFIEIINIFKKISNKKFFFRDTNFLNASSCYADISKLDRKIKWKPKRKIEYILKEYSQLL